MRGRWTLLGLGLCAGCSHVLDIPDVTPSFCAQAANQGHAYCEDFDVGDPSTRWSFEEGIGGASYSIAPSDKSPPNLVDLRAPTLAPGASALAGFDVELDQATFTGLHIEADVRFVTPDGGPIAAGLVGFLLVVDKSGGCVALGAAGGQSGGPASIGAITFTQATGCSALTGGGGPSAGTAATPLGTAPEPNTWFHMIVDVTPDRNAGGGAGALTFDIVGQPTTYPKVPLAAGTLVPSGIPLVGFASELHGPGGPIDVQYDNITIDLTN